MFRPEFLNRVDSIITFKPLTKEQIREIVDLQLHKLQKHLREQEIEIEVTAEAKDRLGEEGFDKVYGARPLRRVITNRIEDQLSEELLRSRIARGDTVTIDIDPDSEGFTFKSKPGAKKEPAGSAAE
jgi:ATP-dependent Clp protease ATP-binding subunit ClpA